MVVKYRGASYRWNTSVKRGGVRLILRSMARIVPGSTELVQSSLL